MLFRGTIAIAILVISAANKSYANEIDVQFSGFASLTKTIQAFQQRVIQF